MSLNDRNYMHSPSPSPAGLSGRRMLISLIFVNAFLYLFSSGSPEMQELLKLQIAGKIVPIHILQVFTACFMHAGFTHILFNMWGLWLFGSLVTPSLDGKKILLLYLTGGVIGNLLFLLLSCRTYSVVCGASGAVCAFMAAAAMLEPNRRFVLLFFPFAPIKTTTLVVCYTILEIFLEITGAGRSVAHLAHLGGFLGGYLLMKLLFGSRLPWDPFRRKAGRSGVPHRGHSFSFTGSMPHPSPDPGAPVTQRELDYLLDKLSRMGINSLSESEQQRLKKARRQMRGEE